MNTYDLLQNIKDRPQNETGHKEELRLGSSMS